MQYRREIDGLRALAVLPVVLFHAGFQSFSGGFVGVDVFFVISGYLITSIILAEQRAGTFTLVNFYERRARRILPALFFVIFACLPLAWLWLLPQDMEAFSQSLVAVSFYVSNILFWLSSGYFDTAAELKPLLHTWSLAVEEQYYLLFPLFLLLVWRQQRARVIAMLAVVACASLAAAQWGAYARPDATFYLLPTRGWELLIGSFVAFYFADDDRARPGRLLAEVGGWIGLLLLVLAVLVFDRDTPFPSVFALVPTVGTALIILCANQQTVVGRVLGHKLLVGIGMLSYSAYLWHQPLFAFARHRGFEEPSRALLCLLIAATGALAWLSWRYVEQPFRDRQRIQRRQIFLYSGLASLLTVGIGLAGIWSKGYPERLGTQAQAVLATAQDVSAIKGSLDEAIHIGEPARVKGVLIGDSHADSIAFALGELATDRGLGVQVLTKVGCPPFTGLARWDMPSEGASCDAHYSRVYERIRSDPAIEFVVISARFTLYLESERFNNGEGGIESGETAAVVYDDMRYKGTLRSQETRRSFVASRITDDLMALVRTGKRIYLIYPIPEVGWNTPYVGVKETFGTMDQVTLSTSQAVFHARNRSAVAVLDGVGEHANLVRVRPEKVFCNTFVKDRCVAIMQSRSLYRDSNHLSNTGARMLLAEFANHFVER